MGATATSAGIAVLSDDALVRRVAEFQCGYPQVAAELAVTADATARAFACTPFWLQKTLDGALPRLVVAAGDPRALKLLFDLKQQYPQYLSDPLLRFSHVMRVAVQLQRVDMLECLAELQARDCDWQWEPNLMSLAVEASQAGGLCTLKWLDAHLPSHLRVVPQDFVNGVAHQGDLQLLRWLCERGHGIRADTADSAASGGRVEVLEYLYEHTSVRCSPGAVCQAAANGAIDVVNIVAQEQTEETCARALSAAVRRGWVDVVRYFVERGVTSAPNALDCAAEGGHLSTLEYLHAHVSSGCTPRAMDSAAIRGHLDIVRFLHENRSEGCTTNAMNGAAAFGHLAVVRFLHEHRSEGSSSRALEMAAANGHVDVLAFLCEHRAESDVRGAIVSAAASGKVAAVKYLYYRSPEARAAAFVALHAAAHLRWRDVLQFLCAEQQREKEDDEHGDASFLVRAVKNEPLWLVNALLPFRLAVAKYFVERGIGANSSTAVDEAARTVHESVA